MWMCISVTNISLNSPKSANKMKAAKNEQRL
jgi:hypothetical protein